MPPERHRARHLEAALGLAPQGTDLAMGIFQHPEHGTHPLEVDLTLVGQSQRSGAAAQQPGAEFGLQAGNALAGRRRAQAQQAARCGNAAAFHGLDEGLDAAQGGGGHRF